MKKKKSTLVRVVALILAEGLLLCGIAVGIRHEINAINRSVTEVSDLKDPSPFRAALLGHLGKIHLGLGAYLRNPDPSMEKQIAESQKEFAALVPEFMKQNAKLFPKTACDEIKRTFSLYQESISHTLAANVLRMERRGVLEKNFTRLLYVIDNHIRPLQRKEQADGEERTEAVLNIENQMRAWQQNLVLAWEKPSDAAKAMTFENDNRGETHLERYSHLELLSRERKAQKEIWSLWQANSALARESFAKESIVAQSQKVMEGEHTQVVSTLNTYLPALPPAEMEAKKQSLLNTMRVHMGLVGVISLLGLASILVLAVTLYRFLHAPSPVADGVYHSPASKSASGPQAKIEMNLKGQISGWSPEAEALYGYTKTEMTGQSIGRLFDSESEIVRLGKELQKATTATFDTTHKTKTGSPIPVRIEFHTVSDASGQASAISLSCMRR